jgi:hypothetical protein
MRGARVARTAGGVALLAVGAALLVLPGPGLVVIAAGLALLAVDHDWARRLLAKVRRRQRPASAVTGADRTTRSVAR